MSCASIINASTALAALAVSQRALALEHLCSLPAMSAHRHAGLFTWWVLQKAPSRGQAGRVLAVEPMSRNVAVMQANLQQHYLTNQVGSC